MNQESEEQMMKAFERHLETAGIRSRAEYLARLKEFLGWTKEQGHDWAFLPAGVGEAWSAELQGRTQQRATINNKINTLRKWGRWLALTDRSAENPMRDLAGLQVGSWLPKNILSIEDTGAFLEGFRLRSSMDVMAKAILEVMYGSGIRISEAVGLKEKDIDWTGRSAKIFEPKTQKERKIPVTEAFLTSLKLYMTEAQDDLISPQDKQEGWVFPQRGGTSIRSMLNHILRREASHLGLVKITSHSMRHMAATHLLKKGAGIRHVQAFLGHETITSTQVYTRVCKEDLKKVLETCHPLEAGYVE